MAAPTSASASASIIDPNEIPRVPPLEDPSHDGLSADWKSFLSHPAVGLIPTVWTNGSNIDFELTGPLEAFKKCRFSSSKEALSGETPKLDAEGSIIAGIDPSNENEVRENGVQIKTILEMLGLISGGSLELPSDFGISQVGNAIDDTKTLINNFIKKLGDTHVLRLDQSPEARNIVWLTPPPGTVTDLRSTVAFTFRLADSGQGNDNLLPNLQDIIKDRFGNGFGGSAISFNDLRVYTQRTCVGTKSSAAGDNGWQIKVLWRLTFSITVSLQSHPNAVKLWITHQDTGMTFSLTAPEGNPGLLALTPLGQESLSPDLNTAMEHIKLIQLIIEQEPTTMKYWWHVTMALQAGGAKNTDGSPPNEGGINEKLPKFYLQYDSKIKRFKGGLIRKSMHFKNKGYKLNPDFLPGQDLDDPFFIDRPQNWNIRDFLPIFDSLPDFLPTTIDDAYIEYSGETKTLIFNLDLIQSAEPPGQTAEPPDQVIGPKISWKKMTMKIHREPGIESYSGENVVQLQYKSNPNEEAGPNEKADLTLAVEYEKVGQEDTWTITGKIEKLTGRLLANVFGSPALEKVIGKLSLEALFLVYTHSKEKQGVMSSFAMRAVVLVGVNSNTEQRGLKLQMQYEVISDLLKGAKSAADILKKRNDESKTPLPLPPPIPIGERNLAPSTTLWRLECTLSASKADQTLGQALAGISEGIVDVLPSFVANIDFPAADATVGTKIRNPISLKALSAGGRVNFSFVVVINSFSLTYAQIVADPTLAPKRIFRFSCDKIPLLKDIPLLNELPQPFDQLEYLWLNGANLKDGLFSEDIESLNQTVLQGYDTLSWRKTSDLTGKSTPGAKNIAIIPGHHFMVLNNGTVIVDHLFAYPKGLDVNNSLGPLAADGDEVAEQGQPNNQPTKGAMTFNLGPLTISAVTLQVKQAENKEGKQEPHLMITMDATFVLGPVASPVITFSLLGFAIGIPLSSVRLDDMSGVFDKIYVGLNGLALGIDKPPITISGGFEHQKEGGMEVYMGGVAIGFPPYTFVGIGEYAILDGYKSVFLYAKLDGPLISLGIATISGVRLGLGFNSMVRTPELDEITQFPFINDKAIGGTGNNPMAILKKILQPPSGRPWVSPEKDGYWLAAGLTLEAFEIVSVTAVAMLAFRDSGLIISFFADAIAQMPPHVSNAELLIIYVEVGLIAVMNFAEGYFTVEASVAPTSFLLVSSCRIYGQFAMTYWFDPNEHAGDWVFSIGGYHPKYEPPAWYPRPKRLGISFVTFGISITGEAYFAITPKALMGGAMIRATLSVGPVRAWLETQFDALINLHPLHYQVSFRISVGVECHIDMWLVDINVSVSIGAQLEIYGPDFGGSAYVDFYLFAFTVNFGASPEAPPPLPLPEFWKLVHRPGPKDKPVKNANPSPVLSLLTPNDALEENAAFKFALVDGNFPMSKQVDSNSTAEPESTGDGQPWFVKGGNFSFRVNTDFAVNHIVLNDISVSGDASLASIYSKPMHVSSPIESTLTIKILDYKTRAIVPTPPEVWEKITPDIKAVPTASWGQYSTATDPLKGNASSHLLSNADATVKLPMGVTISAPKPILARSMIPEFNAKNYSEAEVKDHRSGGKGKSWEIPAFEPEQKALLASALTQEETEMVEQEQLKKLYEEFENKWRDLAVKQGLLNTAGDGLLDQFTGLMEWDKDRPQSLPKSAVDGTGTGTGTGTGAGGTGVGGGLGDETTPLPVGGSPLAQPPPPAMWKLKGDFPARLLARFEDKYLELPRMAVAPA